MVVGLGAAGEVGEVGEVKLEPENAASARGRRARRVGESLPEGQKFLGNLTPIGGRNG